MTDRKYDASLIKPIRGPKIEGERGDLRSSWLLTFRASVRSSSLDNLAATLARIDGIHGVEVEAVDDVTIRVVLRTADHPFDPEGIAWSNAFLVESDAAFGGLVEVNGTPRDWWRPFRPAPPRRD